VPTPISPDKDLVQRSVRLHQNPAARICETGTFCVNVRDRPRRRPRRLNERRRCRLPATRNCRLAEPVGSDQNGAGLAAEPAGQGEVVLPGCPMRGKGDRVAPFV
jgi:hypothetical protein